MRKHTFNEDFFEKIDSQEKAYWLGFIAADGYINKRGNTLGISLDISDKDHIQKFLNVINANTTIIKTRFARFDEGHKFTEKAFAELYSNKIVNDLIKLGISYQKSTSLTKIDIPDEWLSHFIRGYFDGDGCAFETYLKPKSRKGEYYSAGVTFVGTFDFLSYLNSVLPVKVKTLTRDKRTQGSYTLYMRSLKRFVIITEFLYKDSIVSLDRKREKCEIINKKIMEGSSTKEATS